MTGERRSYGVRAEDGVAERADRCVAAREDETFEALRSCNLLETLLPSRGRDGPR